MTVKGGKIIRSLCDSGPTGPAIGKNLNARFNQISSIECAAGAGASAIWTKPTAIKECREAERQGGDLLRARSRPNNSHKTHSLAAISPATEIIDRCAQVVVVDIMSHATMKKKCAGATVNRRAIAHDARP